MRLTSVPARGRRGARCPRPSSASPRSSRPTPYAGTRRPRTACAGSSSAVGPRPADHAGRRGLPRRLRPARGGDLAAPALPRPGDGGDVAAGHGLASHRLEDAPHRGPTGRRSAWSPLGLVLLALGAGAPGEVVITTPFVAALWCRRRRPGGPGLAGRPAPGRPARSALLAGLGYAGSAIVGPRGRHAGRPAGGRRAALAVPAFSLVAFWLYSLGMQRAAVSSATAALIVAQTFVPAAVGVALLGDGVRAGLVAGGVARAGARDRRGGRAERTAPKSRVFGDCVAPGRARSTTSHEHLVDRLQQRRPRA